MATKKRRSVLIPKNAIPKDGKTREGVFPGKFDIDPFKFQYRPALPERVYAYLKSDQSTSALQMKAIVSLLTEHVKDWDVTEPIGDGVDPDQEAAVPFNEEALRRLPTPGLDYLIDAVCSYTVREQADELKN